VARRTVTRDRRRRGVESPAVGGARGEPDAGEHAEFVETWSGKCVPSALRKRGLHGRSRLGRQAAAALHGRWRRSLRARPDWSAAWATGGFPSGLTSAARGRPLRCASTLWWRWRRLDRRTRLASFRRARLRAGREGGCRGSRRPMPPDLTPPPRRPKDRSLPEHGGLSTHASALVRRRVRAVGTTPSETAE
jgi:hypothetical protein